MIRPMSTTTKASESLKLAVEKTGLLLHADQLKAGDFLTHVDDSTYGPGWLLFTAAVETLRAFTLEEVRPLLQKVHKATEAGRFAAGYVAYSAGPAFDPAIVSRHATGRPYAAFHLYDSSPSFYKELVAHGKPSRMDWSPEADKAWFLERCAEIKRHLAAGDTYQVNLSFRMRSQTEQALVARFVDLVAENPPKYASLWLDAETTIASLSPELFFTKNGAHIVCRPMKGTAPIGRTYEETRRNTQSLLASEKDRAENLMIVDMIRNDLGKKAKLGTVKTTSLFDIESHDTVLQMTSTIEAETEGRIVDVFDALFPCASIVGAPKVETTRIIDRLEDSPRGVYTGALGFAAPHQSRFSVAIRTISQVNNGPWEYGAGSGIVWDSDPASEWVETLLKTKVLDSTSEEFGLFETFRWPDTGKLDRHLARLARSAKAFEIGFDQAQARQVLASVPVHEGEQYRLRLTVFLSGRLEVQTVPLKQEITNLTISLASEPVQASDPLLSHKTNRRRIYDRALRSATTDEVLLWNERGEITEFCKGNFVLERDRKLYTPPLECGLLPGIEREVLLENNTLTESVVLLSDLPPDAKVFRINSLTGMIPAKFQNHVD